MSLICSLNDFLIIEACIAATDYSLCRYILLARAHTFVVLTDSSRVEMSLQCLRLAIWLI